MLVRNAERTIRTYAGIIIGGDSFQLTCLPSSFASCTVRECS